MTRDQYGDTGKGRPTSLIVMLNLMILISAGGLLLAAAPATGEDAVKFSREGIRPGTGNGGTTFLFTVTVTSPEEPQEHIEIVIDEKAHEMREIDPGDTTYSDGKDFYYREKLDPGGVVYFFRSGSTTTNSRTLTVGESMRSQYHHDVALIMSLFIFPVIIAVAIFRKIEKQMKEITGSLADIAEILVRDMGGK